MLTLTERGPRQRVSELPLSSDELKTSSAPAARRVGSSNGKRFERLPFSILEPSRPALCETISAVDRPRRVRFKRNLRGLATVRAHRIKHLTRAAVVAASASSAASVFVHSLPTVRPLVGRTSRREGPRLLKVCTTSSDGGLTGSGGHRPKLVRDGGRRSQLDSRRADDGARPPYPRSRNRAPPPGGGPFQRIAADPCTGTPDATARRGPRSARSTRNRGP